MSDGHWLCGSSPAIPMDARTRVRNVQRGGLAFVLRLSQTGRCDYQDQTNGFPIQKHSYFFILSPANISSHLPGRGLPPGFPQNMDVPRFVAVTMSIAPSL